MTDPATTDPTQPPPADPVDVADPYGGHEFEYERSSDLFKCVHCEVYEVTARANGGENGIAPCRGLPAFAEETERVYLSVKLNTADLGRGASRILAAAVNELRTGQLPRFGGRNDVWLLRTTPGLADQLEAKLGELVGMSSSGHTEEPARVVLSVARLDAVEAERIIAANRAAHAEEYGPNPHDRSLEDRGGYSFRPGSLEVLPHAPARQLQDLARRARATLWPVGHVLPQVPGSADEVIDLAYWHTARCLVVLTHLAAARPFDDPTYGLVAETPCVRENDDTTTYVPSAAAVKLQGMVQLSPEVWKLLRGRLAYALQQWLPTTGQLIAELATDCAVGREHPQEIHRRVAALTTCRLMTGWLLVPEIRWPLAAAWAASSLLDQWLDFGQSVRPAMRRMHAGLGHFGIGDRPLYDAPLPGWADLIPAAPVGGSV